MKMIEGDAYCLVICSKAEFNKFTSGEYFLDIRWNGDFITYQNLIQELEDMGYNTKTLTTKEIENIAKTFGCLTYKDFEEDERYEYFEEQYTSKNSDEIIVFGRCTYSY